MKFPDRGSPASIIKDQLASFQRENNSDLQGREKTLTGNYHLTGLDDTIGVAREALVDYMESNTIYPSEVAIHRMEKEVISMIANLWNAPNGGGFMTAGGTESNITALYAARNLSGKKGGSVIIPSNAHVSFWKGCNFLGMEPISVPIKKDHTADVAKMREALKENTIAVIASCGTVPYATIDPIEEIGKLAEENSLYFHVDGAIGGMACPWLKQAGYDIPSWDFSVKGVSSISSDPHKMGFSLYPAGSLIFKNEELLSMASWSAGEVGRGSAGGLRAGGYSTLGILGTRPGSTIAVTWALFNYLGKEGYTKLASKCMELAMKLISEIEKMPGLSVMNEKPKVNLVAISSTGPDMNGIKKVMKDRGWFFFNWQRTATTVFPEENALFVWMAPYHERVIPAFLRDLKDAVRIAESTTVPLKS